jgi:uncharacterized protein (DUF4415 family)
MTDESIDISDIPPLTKSFFDKATVRVPRNPVAISLHVDSDILAWFQKQGPQCEPLMNAALRIYAEAHQ